MLSSGASTVSSNRCSAVHFGLGIRRTVGPGCVSSPAPDAAPLAHTHSPARSSAQLGERSSRPGVLALVQASSSETDHLPKSSSILALQLSVWLKTGWLSSPIYMATQFWHPLSEPDEREGSEPHTQVPGTPPSVNHRVSRFFLQSTFWSQKGFQGRPILLNSTVSHCFSRLTLTAELHATVSSIVETTGSSVPKRSHNQSPRRHLGSMSPPWRSPCKGWTCHTQA